MPFLLYLLDYLFVVLPGVKEFRGLSNKTIKMVGQQLGFLS